MRPTVVYILALTLGLALTSCATAGGGDPDAAAGDGDGGITINPDGASGADANPTGTPDAGGDPNCPTQPCDLIEQCGCAANQACDLKASAPLTGNECRAVSTPGTEANTCASFQDCAAGYVCVGGSGGSSCKAYCAADTDCASPRGQCLIQLTANNQDIPNAKVCSSNCDPTSTAPGQCPSGWGCYIYVIDPDGVPNNGDDKNIVDCTPAGAGTQGAACAAYSDCAAGYLCVTANNTDQCLRTCVNNAGCPSGTTCQQFNPPATVGGTSYGVCL